LLSIRPSFSIEPMFRYRWSCQVIYGRWAEFYELQEAKAAVAKERGWVPSSFWVASAGSLNDFFLEREYQTLEELSAELWKREGDSTSS
jgi:hypothetical protein